MQLKGNNHTQEVSKHMKTAGGCKAPKKEDLRMSLIRGLKGQITFAVRRVQFYPLLFPILQKQIEFADFVLFELLSSAEPTAGPATDRKAYHYNLEDTNHSHNNQRVLFQPLYQRSLSTALSAGLCRGRRKGLGRKLGISGCWRRSRAAAGLGGV